MQKHGWQSENVVVILTYKQQTTYKNLIDDEKVDRWSKT